MKPTLLVLFFWLAVLVSGQPEPLSPSDSLWIHTIRLAYRELGTQVLQTLHLQLGDVGRIQQQQTSTQHLLESITINRLLFDEEEYTILHNGVSEMLTR
ncbi:hypothetical protein F5878DRAFT_668286 [Lentinula raphanica]|uniref:Uncharacterized protein n=1 Tax=Lentinula raphanica TaxID=153919 RepID=A0AA38U3A4_9AGAR|nr:hypothetical protein F5878DRAFT_668286 [Lentinula raphanica]